jgi:hypothetical protein
MAHLDAAVAAGRRPSGGALCELLGAALPAFADVASYGNASPQLGFHAKALRLVADLHRRFGCERHFGQDLRADLEIDTLRSPVLLCRQDDPARFGFEDAGALPAPADARLVASLRRRGALCVSDGLAARITAQTALPAGCADEVALRAAAVAAVTAAVAAAPSGVTALQLAFWLEAQPHDDVAAVAHITRDTVFY